MDEILPPSRNELLVDVLHQLRVANDRIADLESERDTYREIATAGIHALHDVTVERDALRRSNRRLHEERRETVSHERAA